MHNYEVSNSPERPSRQITMLCQGQRNAVGSKARFSLYNLISIELIIFVQYVFNICQQTVNPGFILSQDINGHAHCAPNVHYLILKSVSLIIPFPFYIWIPETFISLHSIKFIFLDGPFVFRNSALYDVKLLLIFFEQRFNFFDFASKITYVLIININNL